MESEAARERRRARDREQKRLSRLLNPEYHREVNRKCYRKNIKAIKIREAARRERNRHSLRLRAVEYRKANREKCNAADRSKRKRWSATRPTFKILDSLRSRLKNSLKRSFHSNTNAARSLLGCSMDDFKLYLESMFKPGMNWSNYGQKGWHIDHIMPCAIFDMANPEHVRRCFHFSNLQPLWACDNLKKGAKPSSNQFNLL